ncbi:MAG: PAS domain S-box protein [Candidatus Marinimicrobia bacterium]|nr:PAS domain S-box protein [Candidatus Neomarinimicrobiota bacterium]
MDQVSKKGISGRASEHKQVEKTRLLENLPGVIYRCANDRDWTMNYISSGCVELLEYQPEDLINNKTVSYGDLIEPDDRDLVFNEVQKAVNEHKSYIIEYRIRTASGKIKWVWEQGIGVFSDDGELLSLEGYITELTESRVLGKEEKYRLLIENIKDAIVISQFDKFIFFNEQFAAMLGYTFDELMMKDYRVVYTIRGVEILRERSARRKRGEDVASQYETVFKRKDGSEIDVEANVTIINYKGSTATFAAIRDISERKRIELEIQKQKQYFEALFASASDAIVSLDLNGNVVSVNPHFEKLFGYTQAEIRGKNLDSLIVSEDGFQDASTITKTVQDGEIAHFERKRKRQDGSFVDVLGSGAPIIVDGEHVGALAIYRDITDRKKAEEERERMISELQEALRQVNTLSGLIPICANCKKIRDNQGYWSDVELYISKYSDAEFSHGLCNDCMKKLYPEQYDRLRAQGKLKSR